MRLRQLTEYGRIVKGVNTTVDVGPNEIPIQAKKWGFKVDKDGRPPTLSKKTSIPFGQCFFIALVTFSLL